ncbi:hypothetical protein MKJ01_04585 [Chryseobacterium sp. SSA4.19]|uniref:hypothetical protein n=1 Tax=Chryseobacterium sp. SSA4.19 TaxID=2919915 RepID=UPI001F4E4A9E|nr:hypothetical protein [Chryseobacterium sp. SSA4.19]MCJ8153042.1 hypothetical protein [Chryseobacterium sp. SSA4.19]
MNKNRIPFIAVFLLFFASACFMVSCEKDRDDEELAAKIKSSQKNILTFEFFKADNSSLSTDYNTSLNGNIIVANLPSDTNVSSLKPAFTVSEKAVVLVNGKFQTSRITANDFTYPVVYTVQAEDGSTKNYTVTVNH